MKTKTCFVISPIGAEGTEPRKHADDFLELLVEPALQPYNFSVVRADKIARASIITEDIITLVQQAELCLVDLTFHNDAYYPACAVVASTGDEDAKNTLLNATKSLAQNRQYKPLHACLAGLTDYYTNTASLAKGIEAMKDLIYSILNDESQPPEERAFALNRLQMMRYHEDQHEDALRDALRVVELCPNDDSYAYNLSMIYEAMDNFSEAAKYCDRFLALNKKPKKHHIEHVAGVYRRAGNLNALEALQQKYGALEASDG